jgi:hypothetical protein
MVALAHFPAHNGKHSSRTATTANPDEHFFLTNSNGMFLAIKLVEKLGEKMCTAVYDWGL